MVFIAAAFLVWEVPNLLLLVRHMRAPRDQPATPSSGEPQVAGPQPTSSSCCCGLNRTAQGFDWRRHHRLNVTYAAVLTLFAPNLFVAHDTHWLWVGGGLPWWGRTLWLLIPSLLILATVAKHWLLEVYSSLTFVPTHSSPESAGEKPGDPLNAPSVSL